MNRTGDGLEEPLVNFYPRNARVCAWVALAGLVLGAGGAVLVAMLASKPAFLAIPAVLGGTLVIGAGIAGIAFAYYAPKVERHLAEFRAGTFLARWTYDQAEWLQFVRSEWESTRTVGFVVVAVFAVLGTLMGMVVWWQGKADILAVGLYALAGAVGGLAIAAGVWAISWRHYQGSMRRVPVTYIGRQAVYWNGSYNTWDVPGRPLTGARLCPGRPAVLELCLGIGRRQTILRIPIPHGKEAEAEDVVRTLIDNPPERS